MRLAFLRAQAMGPPQGLLQQQLLAFLGVLQLDSHLRCQKCWVSSPRVRHQPAFPGLPHPLAGGETILLTRPRSPPPQHGSPGLTHTPRAGASRHTREGRAPPRSPPTPRSGDHRPQLAPDPGRARPGPLPGPAPASRGIHSAELAHSEGRAFASLLYTRGQQRSYRSPGSGGSSLALGRLSRAGAFEEARAAGRLEVGGRRGGGGGRDTGSRLLSPPLTAAPAGWPGVLAHSPSFSQPRVPSASPSPHSHTLSLPHTHTRPLLVPSLACRARATPLTHSARDAGGDRPAPADRAPPARPLAEDRRAPRPRPPGAAARRRGGAAGGGRRPEPGAGPARRALPSGSDTCVETRPPSSSPAPEPSLASGEERRWIARGERKGSARALRGRASPPAPKPSSLRKGNGWGGRGLLPTRNREISPFRCTPSPPSHSLLRPHPSAPGAPTRAPDPLGRCPRPDASRPALPPAAARSPRLRWFLPPEKKRKGYRRPPRFTWKIHFQITSVTRDTRCVRYSNVLTSLPSCWSQPSQ
ncbi:mucin-1-like [Symphalangus syndactylus]|uniref:mucin-1-like n=1 Tax=Symphalangus syndactylus TaxID=9590 RepID=UPI0030072ABF